MASEAGRSRRGGAAASLVLVLLVAGGAALGANPPPAATGAPTVKTFKAYRIEIDPVPPPATDANSPRPRQELRILRDGKVLARVANERVDLYGGELTDLTRKDKRNQVPTLGADITGTGMPVAVVETYDGGAHCCTTLQLFALGGDFRPIGSIHGGNYPVRFRRQRGTPGLVAVIYDEIFAYWKASFADSVAPEVTLAYDPAADDYRFSAALMRKAPPSAATLKAEAARIKRDPAWKKKSSDHVPPALWDRMLALIYGGQAPLARDFLTRAWAGGADERTAFYHDLVECQLRRSVYWPDVAALNGWTADPPGEDCPKD